MGETGVLGTYPWNVMTLMSWGAITGSATLSKERKRIVAAWAGSLFRAWRYYLMKIWRCTYRRSCQNPVIGDGNGEIENLVISFFNQRLCEVYMWWYLDLAASYLPARFWPNDGQDYGRITGAALALKAVHCCFMLARYSTVLIILNVGKMLMSQRLL